MYDKITFQRELNRAGADVVADGIIGPKTVDAFLAVITNSRPLVANDFDLRPIVDDLGISLKQIKAIATVETNGSGFTKAGRVKILYERHKFYTLTDGKYAISPSNDPKPGGYNEDSWDKLRTALRIDPWAAIQSCSWGKFQIMGYHAVMLGYENPLVMPARMALAEVEHYIAFARYIKWAKLVDAAKAISINPITNRLFVKGYNGPNGVVQNNYHVKLAEAMK